MKNAKILIFAITASLLLSSCHNDADSPSGGADEALPEVKAEIEIDDVGYSDSDEDAVWSDSATEITCNGADISINGSGASSQSGIITVSAAGEYVFSGELSGSIIVEATKNTTVQLIFNGISISSNSTAAINVKKAEKVILTLADGSKNHITDTESYNYDDAENEDPSAALFSKSDLTVNGNGSLEINAKFNDGIASKDILRIMGGEFTVNSVDDGIIGRDAILIFGGSFTVNAGGDGIKTTNGEDSALGYIKIQGGTFDVTASADGLQAETQLMVSGGAFSLGTGGGSTNASYSEDGFNEGWGQWPMSGGHRAVSYETTEQTTTSSAKALKAGAFIDISGGTFSIDSSDDSIHSSGSISLCGGTVDAKSGDDGIHADSALSISGGAVSILQSYEGLEACDIIISGGDIKVSAYDDGINGAGGNDGSSTDGRPGQNNFASGNATFKMTAGSLYVSAVGDGIDINGSASVDGGTVYVFGPTNSGNGILDYDSAFEVNGGTFIAFGSSGMLQGFSGGTQASVTCSMPVISKGEVLTLESDDGEVLFSIEVEKQCTALIFSSEKLKVGKEYTLFGGEGDDRTKIGSYTQTQTTMGGSGGGNPGGGHPGGGPGGAPGKPMR